MSNLPWRLLDAVVSDDDRIQVAQLLSRPFHTAG